MEGGVDQESLMLNQKNFTTRYMYTRTSLLYMKCRHSLILHAGVSSPGKVIVNRQPWHAPQREGRSIYNERTNQGKK